MPVNGVAENENQEYYEVLARAREKARRGHACLWGPTTRGTITGRFKARTGGHPPYSWQLDAAEALLLGLDVTLAAGTAEGKKTTYILPLLAHEKAEKMVLVVTPLRELQRDIDKYYDFLELSTIAVSAPAWDASDTLSDRIRQCKYRVLLASPDMILHHTAFSELLRDTTVTSRLLTVIVDQAHCFSPQAPGFCAAWGKPGELRRALPPGVPVLAASATLAPATLRAVRDALGIARNHSFHLNIGNGRANVMHIVQRMGGVVPDFELLKFLIRDVSPGVPLPRTVIFFKRRCLAIEAAEWLREHVHPALRDQIAYIPGPQTVKKRRIAKDFSSGKTNILCATRCADSVASIPDVVYVIQFGLPHSLEEIYQYAGRAGRNGQHARSILFAEDTAFEADARVPKAEDEVERDGDIEWTGDEPVLGWRRLTVDVKDYIQTQGCRRGWQDRYYDNPTPRRGNMTHGHH